MERISLEKYADAVIACIHLALQPTGGGRVAAQVLLSAYNGEVFQLAVSDLGTLDRGNYESALCVIRGRYETRREPHEMVQDGSKIFDDLWRRWKRLEIVERAKQECPNCDGRGGVYLNPSDEEDMRTKPCLRCSGTGLICGCNSV